MKQKLKNLGKDTLIIIAFFFIYTLGLYLLYSIYKNPNDIELQLIDLIPLIFASIILCFIFRKELKTKFKDFFKNFKKNIKKYLPIYVIAYILVYISNNILINIVGNMATNESVNQNSIILYPIKSFISVCLLAPLYEELLFRLNFKNLFKSKWSYTIVTGIFFGSLHLIAATTTFELLYIIPYSILGMTLSYIYFDSDNIYNSIFIHSLNNTIQFILIIIGGLLWKDLYV